MFICSSHIAICSNGLASQWSHVIILSVFCDDVIIIFDEGVQSNALNMKSNFVICCHDSHFQLGPLGACHSLLSRPVTFLSLFECLCQVKGQK